MINSWSPKIMDKLPSKELFQVYAYWYSKKDFVTTISLNVYVLYER
jgi:hypothetical protein